MISIVNFLEVPYKLQLDTLIWRNSEDVTKYFQIQHIEENVHKKWLESLKENFPRNIAFMIKVDNKYVGVTYFHSVDYAKKTADWGIYIYNADLRGHGIGIAVAKQMLQYAKNVLKLNELFLDVKYDNFRAIHLYEKVGFIRIASENKNFLRYRNIL